MNWKRSLAPLSLVMLSVVGGYQLKLHADIHYQNPCVCVVPAEWGEFVGVAEGSGMVFEDKNGTLRVVASLPCNIEGGVLTRPPVLAEIHRK